MDWQPMEEASMKGPVVWVIGQLADDSEVRMHYAQDLSGEYCPPFSGWFKGVYNDFGKVLFFDEVKPLRWRPEPPKESA